MRSLETFLKLLFLVVLLNLVRYFVGGPIEGMTIMEPMHRVMPRFPEVFDTAFTRTDFAISLFYNFMLWFTVELVFHLLHPRLRGPLWVRSLKSYGLMLLFFCSLAAVYMNHYTAEVKSFYLWSMVDALILFPLLALANALLYPLFFRPPREGNPASSTP
ncbi:MAG: hypothetical protein R3244_09600 [Thermoanaerobaculia bacterium]|nr:hypothetical protein [Thermoanaerobaculia bacterium]